MLIYLYSYKPKIKFTNNLKYIGHKFYDVTENIFRDLATYNNNIFYRICSAYDIEECEKFNYVLPKKLKWGRILGKTFTSNCENLLLSTLIHEL